MVLYFSATGNTKLIAKSLAKRLDDEAVDLLTRIKNSDFSELHSERPFVICSPIYVSELPTFYMEFLRKVTLSGNRLVYGIFTNGGYSGIAGGQLRRIISQKGMRFMGYAEFKLPSNHITNKSHKEIDEAEIRKRIKTSLQKAESAAETIKKGSAFKNRHIFVLEYFITVPVAPVLCYLNQGTKEFRAKENCLSCGKCVNLCPMNVISMQNGKPVWLKERCSHCMSCIQNCPVEAIEYGKITEGKKRYTISRVRAGKNTIDERLT